MDEQHRDRTENQTEREVWHKAFWELQSSTVSLLQRKLPKMPQNQSFISHWQVLIVRPLPLGTWLGQSEAADPLPDSDLLSRLQVEAEVLRSFEQQNDGGAEVKLPHCRPLL